MKYTVTWMPSAEAELTRIWLAASDRQAVADAADRIDQDLRFHAESLGEERQGHRIHFEPPLAVTFKVSPDDRLAEVIWVWRISHETNGTP